MSLSAAVLRELMAAGLSGDALLEACERIEAAAPQEAGPLRTARQERNRRYYVSKRLKASYSDVSDANSDAGPTSLNDVQPNSVNVQGNLNPPPPLKPPAAQKSERGEVLAAFDGIVSQERATAIVEHRAKLRKPMTPYAAKQLAKSLAQASDPNAAADLMIERGWQGYRPDWGEGGRGPPHRQAKRNTPLDGLDELERRHAPHEQYQPTLRIAG